MCLVDCEGLRRTQKDTSHCNISLVCHVLEWSNVSSLGKQFMSWKIDILTGHIWKTTWNHSNKIPKWDRAHSVTEKKSLCEKWFKLVILENLKCLPWYTMGYCSLQSFHILLIISVRDNNFVVCKLKIKTRYTCSSHLLNTVFQERGWAYGFMGWNCHCSNYMDVVSSLQWGL